MSAVPVRSTGWILLLGLFATYLALAPCTTDGRGYVFEERDAALGLLASFIAWTKGRPAPPITWTRHGLLPLLLDVPFVKIGKLFVSPDFVLSLEPVFLTAALLAILSVWLRNLSTSGMSLLHGYEYVMGSRFHGCEPGSMPPLRQYLGTPVTAWILRSFSMRLVCQTTELNSDSTEGR